MLVTPIYKLGDQSPLVPMVVARMMYEPIVSPVVLIHVGPRNHVLDAVHIPPQEGALLSRDMFRPILTYVRVNALR